MPPKPEVFAAPDGTEFISKAEYRDYMMQVYYSWRNKNGEELVKHPGELDGQVFDIADSINCNFVIMDITEQIQIDNLTNCRVFIGCCTASIFIRNCTDCTFYLACRQTRLREVTNSKFYVYSQAEVHIEESDNVQFAPFNGGYPEQSAHFARCGLDPLNSLWFDIFDHNDPDKTCKHWSLLPREEYEEKWFPGGECECCVELTAANTIKNYGNDGPKSKSQVGDSFSMDKLRSDDAASKMEKMEIATKELPREVALLIASALGKGIDVSVWLNENIGKITFEIFSNRLQSLSLSVGIEEDWDTKNDLEIATSQTSLKVIKRLFCVGDIVNVSMFLTVAQQKVQEIMLSLENEEISVDQAVSGDKSNSPTSTNKAVLGGNISASETIASSVGEDISECIEDDIDEEVSYDDDVIINEENIIEYETSQSTHVILKKKHKKKYISSPVFKNVPGDSATQAMLPDSPYDEEVAFDLEEEEEADTAEYGHRKYRPRANKVANPKDHNLATGMEDFADNIRKKQNITQQLKINVVSEGTNRRGSKVEKLASPKKVNSVPSSPLASESFQSNICITTVSSTQYSTPGKNAVEGNPIKGGSFSRSARMSETTLITEPKRTSSAPTRILSKSLTMLSSSTTRNNSKLLVQSVNPAVRSSMPSTRLSITSLPTKSNETISISDNVERIVQKVVQKADLYHLVQVYLGFINSYTLVPHRGAIVDSKPRPWLSMREIQTAFFQARTRLSDAQVVALMKLVYKHVEDKSVELNDAEGPKVILNGRLNSESLKKFMVYLRLSKNSSKDGSSVDHLDKDQKIREGPIEFTEWLGGKVVKDKKGIEAKPREFRKALTGCSTKLTKEEMNSYLVNHQIVPVDDMKKEITHRVQKWVLDIDGRKDFKHMMNIAIRKMTIALGKEYKRLSEDQKKEQFNTIRAQLLKKKAIDLRASEKNEAAITKDLYWKYFKDCHNKRFDATKVYTWGAWLSKYQIDDIKWIKGSKESADIRSKISNARAIRKQTKASLDEIEKKFNDAAEKLATAQKFSASVELRKCLVGLRRKAIENGLIKDGKILVTKDVFDQQLGDFLAPRMMDLDPEVRGLAEEARKSHEGVVLSSPLSDGTIPYLSKNDSQFTNLINHLFTLDESKIIAKADEIVSKDKEIADNEFLEWITKKKTAREIAKDKEKQEEEKDNKNKEKRGKLADKAFKQWCKLRKTGKYKSKVDKKIRSVPETIRVEHDGRWSKDTEIDQTEPLFL